MFYQKDITSTLKTIPWFLDLSPQSRQLLTEIAEVHSFNTGKVIFSEGEKHPYLYIILEGKVTLESIVPGWGSLPHLTAESLDVIGWFSLTPVVRQETSSAIAIEPTRLLAFYADTLLAMCERDCDLGFIIMKRLINIIASHLLNHRLHLLELLSYQK